MHLVRLLASCRPARRAMALPVLRAPVCLAYHLRIAMCADRTCTMSTLLPDAGTTAITPRRIAPVCIAVDEMKRRPLLMSDGVLFIFGLSPFVPVGTIAVPAAPLRPRARDVRRVPCVPLRPARSRVGRNRHSAMRSLLVQVPD